MQSKIIKSLPEIWQRWFLKHVDLTKIDNNDRLICGVAIRNNRINMIYNDIVEQLSERDLVRLIKHEIGHVVRGDVLYTDVEDLETMNVAMDAIINTALNISHTDPIKDTIPITVEFLRKYVTPEIPEYPTGWRQIYDILMKDKKNKFDKFLRDILENKNNTENIQQILKEAVVELMLEDKEIYDMVNIKSIVKTNIDIKPTSSSLLDKIIKRIESYNGLRAKKRTYRRENVVPMIKGVSKLPIRKVLIVADVSGSYIEYTETILGLFYWLSKRNAIYKFGVFSNDFHIIKNKDIKNIPGYGGSTYIRNMFKYLKTEIYDLVIVFTDGEIFDYNQKLRDTYKGKILWILDTDTRDRMFTNKLDSILHNNKVFDKYGNTK